MEEAREAAASAAWMCCESSERSFSRVDGWGSLPSFPSLGDSGESGDDEGCTCDLSADLLGGGCLSLLFVLFLLLLLSLLFLLSLVDEV